MNTRIRGRILLLAAVALAAATGGCRKKLTFERWESLPLGASRAAVRSALGKPAEDHGPRMIYTNHEEGVAAQIWFDPRTDRLRYASWADPVHGMREKGSAPQP
ncbi:MAG: hypothetical protein ACPMAQ_14665 [Phycisphaerae bacterium]